MSHVNGVRVHEEEEEASLGALQNKAVTRESAAGLKGKTMTLGQSLHMEMNLLQ